MVEFEYVATILVFVVLLSVLILFINRLPAPQLPSYVFPKPTTCHFGNVDRDLFLESIASNCSGYYILNESISYYDIKNYIPSIKVDEKCSNNSLSSYIISGNVYVDFDSVTICEQ